MTNQERITKLRQAEALLLEVFEDSDSNWNTTDPNERRVASNIQSARSHVNRALARLR